MSNRTGESGATGGACVSCYFPISNRPEVRFDNAVAALKGDKGTEEHCGWWWWWWWWLSLLLFLLFLLCLLFFFGCCFLLVVSFLFLFSRHLMCTGLFLFICCNVHHTPNVSPPGTPVSMRIWVIDDDSYVSEFLKIALRGQGHAVDSFLSHAEVRARMGMIWRKEGERMCVFQNGGVALLFR